MQKTACSLGDTPTWSAAQLARVPRLIRLITEIKTNPRQTPEQLYRTLGISRSRYFQDKSLLERAFGFKVQFNRAKHSYEILEDPYLPLVDLKLSEAFALILAVRQLSAAGDYILTYEAIEGIKKIVASAQPELRSFLQNVLDETVLRQGFGCDASILESLRQACADHHVLITYEHYDQEALWCHEVDPYQLFFRRRALYLDASDSGRVRACTLTRPLCAILRLASPIVHIMHKPGLSSSQTGAASHRLPARLMLRPAPLTR